MKRLFIDLRKTALIIGLSLLSMSAFGQLQVENSDFEQWDNYPGENQEPTNWNSFMTADANCTLCGAGKAQRIERSTDVRSGSSGSYSARIWSTSTLGIVANGNMTLGKVNMGSTTANSSSNYNHTIRSNPDFNQLFTGKPDSLVVWVKFNPVTASDKARISATIHDDYDYRDPEDANAGSHVVAKAVVNYGKTNGWKRISIPFDYTGPSTTPAYILITFTTNEAPGGGKANDEVFIDDLEMIYNPTQAETVTIAPATEQNLTVGQDGTQLTATESTTASARAWKYGTNATGPYGNTITGQTATTYTPNFATVGTYYVVCESTFGTDVITSNAVKINVADTSSTTTNTVTIAPTAVQNLYEGQAGTVLTATESTTADAREWKVSVTQGSGYTSFGQPQTALTYTPAFANEGTYYVVCQSTFGSDVVTSNEVKIVVTKDLGLTNNALANVLIYGVNNNIMIDMTDYTSNANIQIFSANGQLVKSQPINANQLNEVNVNVVEGIYFYTIQSDNDTFVGKVFIR